MCIVELKTACQSDLTGILGKNMALEVLLKFFNNNECVTEPLQQLGCNKNGIRPNICKKVCSAEACSSIKTTGKPTKWVISNDKEEET